MNVSLVQFRFNWLVINMLHSNSRDSKNIGILLALGKAETNNNFVNGAFGSASRFGVALPRIRMSLSDLSVSA